MNPKVDWFFQKDTKWQKEYQKLRMIRGGTTGSSFKTTKLWGNEQLLVEDGTGTWSHTDGRVVAVEDIYWFGKKMMENGKF